METDFTLDFFCHKDTKAQSCNIFGVFVPSWLFALESHLSYLLSLSSSGGILSAIGPLPAIKK